MLWLHDRAIHTEHAAEDTPRCTPDPDDDYLVALALAYGTGFLVSGDPDLLGLPEKRIPGNAGAVIAHVLTPREFLEELERTSS